MHVVDDRALGAIALADRVLADGAHVQEQVVGEAVEHLALPHAEDRLVEADIGLGVLVDPGLDLPLRELAEHLPEAPDLRVRAVQGRKARGHALQGRPRGDRLDDLLLALAGDEGAAARQGDDEPLVLEPLQRLADRGPAHPELLAELALVETVLPPVPVHVHLEDRGAKLTVDPVLEGEGLLDRTKLDGGGGGHGDREGSSGLAVVRAPAGRRSSGDHAVVCWSVVCGIPHANTRDNPA